MMILGGFKLGEWLGGIIGRSSIDGYMDRWMTC